MITAKEAKELYEAPPFTLEEIETRIRDAARKRNYVCFDLARVPQEIQTALSEAGYDVQQSGSTDLIVNW